MCVSLLMCNKVESPNNSDGRAGSKNEEQKIFHKNEAMPPSCDRGSTLLLSDGGRGSECISKKERKAPLFSGQGRRVTRTSYEGTRSSHSCESAAHNSSPDYACTWTHSWESGPRGENKGLSGGGRDGLSVRRQGGKTTAKTLDDEDPFCLLRVLCIFLCVA